MLRKYSKPRAKVIVFAVSRLGQNSAGIISCMEHLDKVPPAPKSALLLLFSLSMLVGCGGGLAGSNSQPAGNPQATLAISPSTLNFGSVAVGRSSSLNGTLTAASSDVVVSSASWNGSGFSVSGITFPVTIPAGKIANYTVTFAPPNPGASSGTLSFVSNAADAKTQQTFSGTGTVASSPTITLSWTASTSIVAGYNIYRGSQANGPYARLNSALVAGTSYTDANVQSGSTYYYVATAVNSNQVEGGYSNQATASVP